MVQGPLETGLEMGVPASYNDVFPDKAVRDHVGYVWYQRDVRVPRGWAGERIHVRLDSATHEGMVWVDDTLVAHGYMPFSAEGHVAARVLCHQGVVHPHHAFVGGGVEADVDALPCPAGGSARRAVPDVAHVVPDSLVGKTSL